MRLVKKEFKTFEDLSTYMVGISSKDIVNVFCYGLSEKWVVIYLK